MHGKVIPPNCVGANQVQQSDDHKEVGEVSYQAIEAGPATNSEINFQIIECEESFEVLYLFEKKPSNHEQGSYEKQ